MWLGTKKVYVLLLALLSFLLLGCDQKGRTEIFAQTIGSPVSPNNMGIDPCAITLAPDQGNIQIEQTIFRIHQQLRGGQTPSVYLEQLGWLYISQARVSFDPGFYVLAELTAECMEKHVTDSLQASLLKGHALHSQHQFAEAEGLARRLVEQRGLWFDYGLLGDALMEQGDIDGAVQAYQQMMDQRPGPQAYSRAAHIRWLKGDLEGAIEMMRMSVAGVGSRAAESKAWSRVRLALYQFQAGHNTSAAAHLKAALQRQPQYPPALFVQGRLLLVEGDVQQAIEVLKQACSLNALPEYQWMLIEALRMAGQSKTAADYEVRLMRRGAIEDARTFALYLADVGKEVSTALHLAQQELKTRKDIHTLDTYAWVLYAMGRYEQARDVIRRAVALGTQDARLFLHAGFIASKLNRYDEARDWLRRAMTIEQMLLPSERSRLHNEFAALKPQTNDLATTQL